MSDYRPVWISDHEAKCLPYYIQRRWDAAPADPEEAGALALGHEMCMKRKDYRNARAVLRALGMPEGAESTPTQEAEVATIIT